MPQRAARVPLEKDKAGAPPLGSLRQRVHGRIRDRDTVPGHRSCSPHGRHSQPPGPQTAQRWGRTGAVAAGGGIAEPKRRHQPNCQRWWQGKAVVQESEPGRCILSTAPPAIPRTAPPGRRTHPPRGSEPPRPLRPVGMLTGPGGPGSRSRRRPLRPRPYHLNRIQRQQHH